MVSFCQAKITLCFNGFGKVLFLCITIVLHAAFLIELGYVCLFLFDICHQTRNRESSLTLPAILRGD